jgi:carbamoyl-phosphate synthase large subunit
VVQLGALQPALRAAGVETLAVINTPLERARMYFRYRPTPVMLLSDPECLTHQAFGVPHGELLFVAPELAAHYVEKHRYAPPADGTWPRRRAPPSSRRSGRGRHASRARNDAQSPSIARAPGRMGRRKTCSAGAIVKVLVTGAGALVGQGIIRSLMGSSLSPVIVAADPSPLAAGLYWTRHRHLVPMASDPAYVQVFENLLDRERPDAVIPGTDVELVLFAENRARWEERFGTHVIISNPNVVRITDDKYQTYRFFRDHGFAAPDSCLPGEESALIERVGFPLIVKPRVGARSVGVMKVQTKDELARALATGDGLVIQECVATEHSEYTAGTLTFEGRCDASIVMRRDLRDGNTYRAYVEAFPELNVEVRRMAEALGSHGPANIQFRLDALGRAKVFEINGRFSGTTPLRMRAGFNEVEMVLRRILRGEPIKQPSVHPMTILRHFTETVVPAGEELP